MSVPRSLEDVDQIGPNEVAATAAENGHRWGAAEWGILALAFAIRATWAGLVPMRPISDSSMYDLFARNIIEGNGYGYGPGELSAYWPVGTSAVCALLYRLFGHTYTPIVVLNLLVGGATAAIVMRLAGSWFGPRAGRLAGLSLAIWPGQVEFTTVLASELWFNVCYLAWLLVASSPRLGPVGRGIVGGAALAAATYIRPLSLPLPILLAWSRLIDPATSSDWRSSAGFKRLVAETAITFAMMAILIAPWSVRNYRLYGKFVLVSTNAGANFWMGNNPATDGAYMPLPKSVETMKNEVERDEFLKREAMDYIKRDPLAFVKRTAIKLVKTHDRESIGVTWNEKGFEEIGWTRFGKPLKIATLIYWWGMLALAFGGIIAVWKAGGIGGILGNLPILFWVFFAFTHAIIVSGDRYHYPSVPMIAALAGLGAARFLPMGREVPASGPRDLPSGVI